ncbi:MAG: TonB-dependent receptor plug domain-containing protein [Gemmatimonadetes bacterium]|nr:TonB-dependent receptor plug domain-containing protein [Gemmatimonadota bacterium]
MKPAATTNRRAPTRWGVAALAVGSVLAGSPLAAQHLGTIRGVVLEYGTRRPVSNVRVTVLGSDLAAVTDRTGRYQLLVPTSGELILRAHRAEYAAVVELVRPVADAVMVVNFTLAQRTYVLDALQVEGRDTAAGRSGVIPERELERRPDASLGEVLDGVSGVQLVRASGQVGRGYQLRIRGARSFSFPATPLVFVDGVRVDVTGVRGGPGIFELLDTRMIGRVEVLRGPAAAVRYGTDAMNGVILVSTKR